MKKAGKNKGFSLVEGVIALAVITIISVSVTVLCMMTAKSTPKIYAKFQASNIAADVVTCFKLACEDGTNLTDQELAFGGYLYFYVGEECNGVEDSLGSVYTYEFTMDSVRAVVTATFASDEQVTIKTYLGTQEDVLYSYGYSLAGGEFEVV